MIFKPFLPCKNCNNDIRIIAFDKENKSIKYTCEKCLATEILSFKDVQMKRENVHPFVINEKGILTYKCSCGCHCNMTIDLDEDDNQSILDAAYSEFCVNCYLKHFEGISICDSCSVEFTDEINISDEFTNYHFCSKECFLNVLELGEYEELDEYYSQIERDIPYDLEEDENEENQFY